LAAALLLCVSAGFAGGWLGAMSREHQTGLDVKAQQQIIDNESQLISSIADRVGESVVSIDILSTADYTDYYGRVRSYEEASAGTGIILSEDGVVITNRHVVPEGSSKVSVVLSDGTQLDDVEVIGRTAANDSLDIAFLKIRDLKGHKLTPAKLGDSSAVEVGDKVVAIGNALGMFQNTVTQGIISGYGRNVTASDSGDSDSLQNLFQTDAAINHGNSGGPLVNLDGEVIGINTAVAGDAENIGFAIPINDAKGLIETVLQTGKFERPYLGVRYLTLTDDYAVEYDLDVKRGAFIVPNENGDPSILAGSPADKAGLKERDVITKINGDSIDEKNSLSSLIGKHRVGEEVTLTIRRDGKDIEVKATLAAQE
jgi:serine protease Do